LIVSLKTGIRKIKTLRINLLSVAENNKIGAPTRKQFHRNTRPRIKFIVPEVRLDFTEIRVFV
jgi:hypothetical protein